MADSQITEVRIVQNECQFCGYPDTILVGYVLRGVRHATRVCPVCLNNSKDKKE